METYFINTKVGNPKVSIPKFKRRDYYTTFKSNIVLYKHIRSSCHDSLSKGLAALSSTLNGTDKVLPTLLGLIRSDLADVIVNGYSFRGYHYLTVPVAFTSGGSKHDVCADSGAQASLISREFLLAGYPDVTIAKMPTPIIVRGIGDRKHDASEFAKVPMFFEGRNEAGKTRIAIIEREFYIVGDLPAKALIGVDILKLERMILDFATDMLKIGSCQHLTVPVQVKQRGPRISASVFARKRTTIPPRTNYAILITGSRHHPLRLPNDRDFIFEPSALDTLSPCAHIVDASLSHVFIRNDTDTPVVLGRNQALGKVTEYELTGCFPVNPDNELLANRPPAKTPSRARYGVRTLLTTAAAFTAAVTSVSTIVDNNKHEASSNEVMHPTGVTIF